MPKSVRILRLKSRVTRWEQSSAYDISPFGFSDLYLRQDNPFRAGEKEGFKGGTKVR